MVLADFAEQSRAVNLLQRSLSRGRLGHAYLLSGDDLAFLENFAHAFVKTLFCEEAGIARQSVKSDKPDACNTCRQCRKVDSGNHPDIHILRPESKLRMIRMEPSQDFMRRLHSKSYEGGFKVGIISAVDRMNTQAANAFLKTLEEPTGRTVFILLTTEVDRLLDTIISRCLRLHFPGTGEPEFPDISRSVVEKIVSLSGKDGATGILSRYGLLEAVMEGLKLMTGEIQEMLEKRSPLHTSESDLEPKIREQYETELKASIESEYRLQRSKLFLAIQWLFRDVWILAEGVGDPRLTYPQFESFSRKLAEKLNRVQAAENLSLMDDLQNILHTNVQEALAVEVCFLNLNL